MKIRYWMEGRKGRGRREKRRIEKDGWVSERISRRGGMVD